MKLSETKQKTMLIGTFSFAVAITVEAEAACNSTVNGYPMPWNECEATCEVYGSYPNGHYVRDGKATGQTSTMHRNVAISIGMQDTVGDAVLMPVRQTTLAAQRPGGSGAPVFGMSRRHK